MKYRIQRLSYFSGCLIIFMTVLNGAISIPFSNIAIAQNSQSDEAKSNQLIKAQEVTQEFFDSLIEEKFDKAREYLSPNLKNYVSATDIQQQWRKILDNMGAFVKYRRIRALEFSRTNTVVMTANFENIISDFVVTLDDNHQITAVDFLWIGNIQTNAEEFVDALSNGQYGVARGYLAPDLKTTILPKTIEQRWLEILETTGPLKQRSNSQVIKNSSGYDVVLVNLEFEQENRSFMILFNTFSEIVGVDFPELEE
ncbi:MAG: DUF3887 domain-containing protein [Xenococcaceae cyanobacterium MO_167.B27]|nr:DUF3887 domain-containing protein [Xenococcaceae cyanobacterium MO_167.B27]